MLLFWILFILTVREGWCGEVCTTTAGGITIQATCSDEEYCCSDNTSCCAGLPTAAIVVMAILGAIICLAICILVIYNICQKKKERAKVHDDVSGRSSPFIHPPPNLNSYGSYNSGSRISSPGNLQHNLPNIVTLQYPLGTYNPFQPDPPPLCSERDESVFKMDAVEFNEKSRDHGGYDMNIPEYPIDNVVVYEDVSENVPVKDIPVNEDCDNGSGDNVPGTIANIILPELKLYTPESNTMQIGYEEGANSSKTSDDVVCDSVPLTVHKLT